MTFRSTKQLVSIFCALCILGIGLVFTFQSVFAIDPVEDLQKQINELEHLKQLSVDATKPLESELKSLESKMASARNGVINAKKQAIQLAEDIEKREEELAVQHQILAKRVAEQYKRGRLFSPLMTFLATNDAAQLTKDLAYRSSVKAQDNRLIQSMSADLQKLEADKTKQESDQVRLAALEKQLDEQAEFFRIEISKDKDYQSKLAGQIAAL